MSAEGHQDWIGGVAFSPKGNILATCSGDGCVKVWDFMNAKCSMTYPEHGQPVWAVDFHYSGEFLLSCCHAVGAGQGHAVNAGDNHAVDADYGKLY